MWSVNSDDEDFNIYYIYLTFLIPPFLLYLYLSPSTFPPFTPNHSHLCRDHLKL